MRSALRTVVVVLLAAGLLALFLRNVDLAQVWSEITRADPSLLLLALVTMILNLVLRAHRWQYLLQPLGATRFSNAFRTTTMGFAASFLLPARAGEFLRPYLMARRERFSATATFATVVLERLLDLAAVLILFGTFLLLFDPGMAALSPSAFDTIKLSGLIVAGGAGVALAGLFFLAGDPERLGRALLRIEQVLPARFGHAVSGVIRMFASGLASVRQPRRMATALLLSFPLWLDIAAGIWLVSRAFHIELPFTGSFLVLALLVVGVAVPTPGGVGGFHYFYRLAAVTFYGAPADRAVGAAIVLHALSFLPSTVLGGLFMTQEGLDLTRMRGLSSLAAAEEQKGEVPVLRSSGR